MNTIKKNRSVAVILCFLIFFSITFLFNYFLQKTAMDKAVKDATLLSIILTIVFSIDIKQFRSIWVFFFSLIAGALSVFTSLILDLIFSTPLDWTAALKKGLVGLISTLIILAIFRFAKKQ